MIKMNIAFLGWGSLRWDRRELRTKGDWHEDGPLLPVEFRRLSNRGRITLVLHPDAEDVQALWILAGFEDLQKARENMREVEGTPNINRIGYVSIPDDEHVCNAAPEALETIKEWCEDKGLDAVVWTDLPENPDKFREETGMELNDGNIIKYLGSLTGETLEKAREYVKKTPLQVDTSLRGRIREELDW